MAFLGDLQRWLDQHRPSSPQAQAERARHGCKIAENIRRAREYRRPRKAPVCPLADCEPLAHRTPWQLSVIAFVDSGIIAIPDDG